MNDRIIWQGEDLLLRFCTYIHNKYNIPFNYIYKVFKKYLYFIEYYIQLDYEKTLEDEYILISFENEDEDAFEFINEWIIYLNEKGLNPYRNKIKKI